MLRFDMLLLSRLNRMHTFHMMIIIANLLTCDYRFIVKYLIRSSCLRQFRHRNGNISHFWCMVLFEINMRLRRWLMDCPMRLSTIYDFNVTRWHLLFHLHVGIWHLFHLIHLLILIWSLQSPTLFVKVTDVPNASSSRSVIRSGSPTCFCITKSWVCEHHILFLLFLNILDLILSPFNFMHRYRLLRHFLNTGNVLHTHFLIQIRLTLVIRPRIVCLQRLFLIHRRL
jgi:hypothetical protein